MKFVIQREALLKPLQLIAGVVEKRQTMPVLSNVLIDVDGEFLSLTGTDSEVELMGRVVLETSAEVSGKTTVSAKKLMDICKSLADGSLITFDLKNEKVILKSGSSRFSLATLPADSFPNVESPNTIAQFDVSQGNLKHIFDHTAFSMAQQDVRYYLNGMLLAVDNSEIKAVATDGHRLAVCQVPTEGDSPECSVIVPRKGILELGRLLTDPDEVVTIMLGSTHLRATTGDFIFTTKLVDGKFPDYNRVIPRHGDKVMMADRNELRRVLSRAAILSNEKYRGVRLIFQAGSLTVFANNPEQEEAEESIGVEFDFDHLEIGFNVNYLLDVLGVISSDKVKFVLTDANCSVLIQEDDGDALFVVMPMRL